MSAAPPSTPLDEALDRLPKVELHCHVEGTMRPTTVVDLARRNKVALPTADPTELYRYTSLDTFLEIFWLVQSVLGERDDWARLAYESVVDGAAHGRVYAETFFTPARHLAAGQSLSDIVAGLADGIAAAEDGTGSTCMLVCDIDRAFGPQAGLEMVEKLVELRRAGAPGMDRVLGVGMDSTELGVDPRSFAPAFAAAAAGGFRRTAHQGEDSGLDAIAACVDTLGAERIDHGLSLGHDDELVKRFATERIPLTMCPNSNIRIANRYERLEDHPLASLRAAGVLATVNTDDPALTALDLGYEYRTVAAAFGWGWPEMVDLAAESVEATWLDDDGKRDLARTIRGSGRRPHAGVTAIGRAMDDLVPLVDVSGWSDPARRQGIAADVDAACRTIGFLQVSGHAVPAQVLERVLQALDGFWARPEAEKRRWASPSAEVNRGYAPLGDESLSYSLGVDAPPDLFEAFNIGPDSVPDDAIHTAERHRFFAPNIWPDEPGSLRPALVAYFDEIVAFAHRLTSIFAVALGLPESFFEPHISHSTETLRTINYVRAPGSPDPLPGQLRMGPHTDYGIVTILWADPVPGLQIVGPDGGWHDVVAEPGAFLVNLGDLLAQWTNDRWRSTVHRVVPPPAGVGGPARRRSMAFFLDGNYDALVECLPTCTSADDPPRYAPVLAGDHLLAKLIAPRRQEPTTAASTLGGRLRPGSA